MKTKEAVDFFGSLTKVAEVLGITPQAVFYWGEVVPERNALRLSKASGGVIKYDMGFYDALRKSKRKNKSPASDDGAGAMRNNVSKEGYRQKKHDAGIMAKKIGGSND